MYLLVGSVLKESGVYYNKNKADEVKKDEEIQNEVITHISEVLERLISNFSKSKIRVSVDLVM